MQLFGLSEVSRKIKHLLTHGNSRELEVLLARAGYGCVVNSGFTLMDRDRLAKEKF